MRLKFKKGGQRLIVSCVVIIGCLLAGCDNSLQVLYDQGCDCLSRKNYDCAIGKFESALSACTRVKNKDCQLYYDKLVSAKYQAGEYYYTLAQQKQFETDLTRAKEYIDKSLIYQPISAEYQKLRQRIIEDMLVVEELRRTALDLAKEQKWDQAISAMDKAIQRYRTLPGGQSDLEKIKKQAYDFYFQQARDAFDRDDWPGALELCNMALVYRPNGSEAKGIKNTIYDYRLAVNLINEAKIMLNSDQYPEGVVEKLVKARKLYPTHPEVNALLQEAKQKVCDFHLDNAQAMITNMEFHGAVKELKYVQSLLRNYKNTEHLLAVAAEKLSSYHVGLSDRYMQKGLYGNALLGGLTAIDYQPSNDSARNIISSCRSKLDEMSKYSLIFVGLDGGIHHQGLADHINSNLINDLVKSKITKVVIQDGRYLNSRSILNMTANQYSRIIPDSSKLNGLIVGRILENHIRVDESTSFGKSRFQSGVNLEPNPAYTKAVKDLNDYKEKLEAAYKALAAAQAELDTLQGPVKRDEKDKIEKLRADAEKKVETAQHEIDHAREDVDKAQKKVARTDVHISTPVISEFRYPILNIRRTAVISIEIKVIDPATGQILLADIINAESTAADDLIIPDPVHNVKGKILNLPPEKDMIDSARESVSGKIFDLMKNYLQDHSRRFIETFRSARDRQDHERAMEEGMLYLFSRIKGGDKTGEVVSFMRSVIAGRNENQVPDIAALLKGYCSVLK